MTTFHSLQSDFDRQAYKNENAGTFNFTLQIATSICTITFAKREKSDAVIFKSGRSRLSLICNFIHGSGKEAALLPLPPLRTGREGFPSSGSSRYKAPLLRSRFT
jgi:hypothetical protein